MYKIIGNLTIINHLIALFEIKYNNFQFT